MNTCSGSYFDVVAPVSQMAFWVLDTLLQNCKFGEKYMQKWYDHIHTL